LRTTRRKTLTSKNGVKCIEANERYAILHLQRSKQLPVEITIGMIYKRYVCICQ